MNFRKISYLIRLFRKWCSINSIFSIGIWTPQEAPSVFAIATAQNFTDRKELKNPTFYPNQMRSRIQNQTILRFWLFVFLEISRNFVPKNSFWATQSDFESHSVKEFCELICEEDDEPDRQICIICQKYEGS